MYPSNGTTAVAATLEQTQAFLEEYRTHRIRWTTKNDEVAWAAGLWVLTYNAKKESLGGGTGCLRHLEHDVDTRARLARI